MRPFLEIHPLLKRFYRKGIRYPVPAVVLLRLAARNYGQEQCRQQSRFLCDHRELCSVMGLPGYPSKSKIDQARRDLPNKEHRCLFDVFNECVALSVNRTRATDGKAFHDSQVNNNPKTAKYKDRLKREKREEAECLAVIGIRAEDIARPAKKMKKMACDRKRGSCPSGKKNKADKDGEYHPPVGFKHATVTADVQNLWIESAFAGTSQEGEVTLFLRDVVEGRLNASCYRWCLDRLFDTETCHEFVSSLARIPSLPLRRNASTQDVGGQVRAELARKIYVIGKNEACRLNPRLKGILSRNNLAHRMACLIIGMKQWKRATGHRFRTRIETLFSAVQARFGDCCTSRSTEMQLRDVYEKLLAWNFYLLCSVPSRNRMEHAMKKNVG